MYTFLSRPPLAIIGRRLLSLMLAASALWTLFPESWNRTVTPPFGWRRDELAFVALGVLYVYVFLDARRFGARRAFADAVWVIASLLVFAVLLGNVMETSANGYFTASALTEALILLLGAQVVALAMHMIIDDATTERTSWQRGVDALLASAAILVVSFWIFVALELHFVAVAILWVTGVCYALLLVILGLSVIVGVQPRVRERIIEMDAHRRNRKIKRHAPTRDLSTGRATH